MLKTKRFSCPENFSLLYKQLTDFWAFQTVVGNRFLCMKLLNFGLAFGKVLKWELYFYLAFLDQ